MKLGAAIRRGLRALEQEFKTELEQFTNQYSGVPSRICRSCFKPGADSAQYYAFEHTGPCDRCQSLTEPTDSIGVACLR